MFVSDCVHVCARTSSSEQNLLRDIILLDEKGSYMIKNEHFYMIERINCSYPGVIAAHLASAGKIIHLFSFGFVSFKQISVLLITLHFLFFLGA